MPRSEEDRRLVLPRGVRAPPAEDDEPGDVGGVILDALLEDVEAVPHGRLPARQGRPFPVFQSLAGALGGARRFHPPAVGQVFPKPVPALGQGLGMGIHPLQPPPGQDGRHEMVMDGKEDFPHDPKRCRDKPVQGEMNGPLQGVFHGDDGHVGPFPLHGVKNVEDRFHGDHDGP